MKLIVNHLAMTCAAILALVVADKGVGAPPLLIDIKRAGSGTPATPQEFTAAGVEEDLSGATVAYVGVPSAAGSGFAVTGLVFTFSSQFTASYDVGPLGSDRNSSGNALLDSYVYLDSLGAGRGPATVTVSGLASHLVPQTRYRLYLFGTAGSNQAQNAEFTFPPSGVTKTTLVPGALRGASVSFYFTTGSVVTNSIAFTWARAGTNQYSAFNGIAITVAQFQTVQVPRITRIGINEGAMDLLFDGKTGHYYVLESTPDLKSWTPLALTPVAEESDWRFLDTNTVAGTSARFYRISSQLSSD